MNEQEIKQLLDKYAEFQSKRDLMMIEKQSIIDAVYTPEIRTKVAEIEAEWSGKSETVNEKISEIEKAIKDGTLPIGASVKGMIYQAIYSKGRVTWDTKALDGYAAGHPEIAQFRKEGDPSISIRKN